MKKKEMFFLPAELVKEARNEVLSLWMETEHEARQQFRVSVFTRMKWFKFCFLPNRATAFSHPPALCKFKTKNKKKGRKKEKKSVSSFDSSISGSGWFFCIFSFSCCKIFVMVVIKVLLNCRVADKWHSVCEKKYACVILYFQQFYATSHNFT